MIKGIHTSAAGMLPMMTRLDVIANNLANMNTTGFKRDEVFMHLVKDAALAQAQGAGNSAEAEVQHVTDFSEGSLNPTNNPLDLAMQGRGFFVIDTPQGMRYTRNGNFTLTTQGVLVTAKGDPVIGTSGRIQIPNTQDLSQGKIVVSESGEIIVDNKSVARLRIVDFADTSVLMKEDGSLFSGPLGLPVNDIHENKVSVRQGFLEGSNVEGLEEMIALVELTRNFESNQRVIQTQDTTLEKTNEVGRFY
jgi:flagellar basal-body rod protein FlgF